MRRRLKEGGKSAEKKLRNEHVKRLQRNMVWKMFFYAFLFSFQNLRIRAAKDTRAKRDAQSLFCIKSSCIEVLRVP